MVAGLGGGLYGQPTTAFTASSTFAQRPQAIDLSWTVPVGVGSVVIQPGIGDVLPATVNGVGSIEVSPIGRVTYELWVDGAMAESVAVIGLPEKSKVHLYPCIGQSNMVGAGSVRDPVLDAPIDKVLQFGSRDGMESQWVLAEHRLTDIGSTGNSIGMGLEFAKAMLAHENDPDVVIGLINHAMGSSAIQWWASGVVDDTHINPQTGRAELPPLRRSPATCARRPDPRHTQGRALASGRVQLRQCR